MSVIEGWGGGGGGGGERGEDGHNQTQNKIHVVFVDFKRSYYEYNVQSTKNERFRQLFFFGLWTSDDNCTKFKKGCYSSA